MFLTDLELVKVQASGLYTKKTLTGPNTHTMIPTLGALKGLGLRV